MILMPLPLTDLIDAVFERPRMYCGQIKTFQDVLIFVQGICHGAKPPHGCEAIPGFADYVLLRFGGTTDQSWFDILNLHYGGMPCDKACEGVRTLLHEWQLLSKHM